MMICDAHCHFFSSRFFSALAREAGLDADNPAALPGRLAWDSPQSDDALADRWIAELDRHDVSRAMLIASVPGDEDSVAAPVRRHPTRIAGAFMLNPSAPDAFDRVERAFGDLALRTVCLFPAMHHVAVDNER